MEYTKGEWGAIKMPVYWLINLPNNNNIATVKKEADAQLIVSAPDLYEACKDILDFLRTHGYNTDLIKQALAKAEGR